MTPFKQFTNGLYQVREDFNEAITEMLAFAEIMARKQNTLELDENGFFYVTCSGPIDEIIPETKKILERLERIKKQKDTQR
jgi:hypothetical protein